MNTPRPGYQRAQVLITVKTYPNPSKKYEETVCVAGVRLDRGVPEWIRLYPIRFRTVQEDQQFKKYELIEVDITPHGTSDPRIESYRPDQSTIRHLSQISADDNWAERRELIGELRGAVTSCGLIAAATEKPMSEPAPSLGLIKPRVTSVAVTPGKLWTPGQAAKIEAASQPTLLGDGLPRLEPPPYNVHYRYRCEEPGCRGHNQKVLDWELGQAGRRWSRDYGHDEGLEQIRKKWEDTITSADRDLYFYIGNQHQHRRSFSVLGTWWPKSGDEQMDLFSRLDVND